MSARSPQHASTTSATTPGSGELLRIFIEHSPVSLAVFDRHMRYLAVSRRWRDDYHLGDRNLVGLSHYEVFPEIGEAWKAIHRRALAGETLRSEHDRFERQDGSVQWLRWEIVPWRDEAGAIGGIVVFVENITERVQVEEALRESRDDLSRAQRVAKVGNWRQDRRTGDVRWSRETHRIFGVPQGTPLTPETYLDAVHPDDRPYVEWARGAVSGRSYEIEYRVLIGKTVRRVRQLVELDVDEHGEVRGEFGTVQDVTELADAETGRRRYELLASRSREIILFIRRSDGRIVEANEAAIRAYGYSRDELLRMSIADLRAPGSAPPSPDTMKAVDTGGLLYEIQHRRKDGSVFPVEVSLQGASIDSEPVLVSVARDITERVRAAEEKARMEERLRHSQQLEAIGTLAGGIAHDFNNILSPIIGYAEMAADGLEPSDPARSDLRQILVAAARAKDLVKQILAVSRMGEDVVLRPTDVRAVVQEALALLRASLPTSIQIRQDLQPAHALAHPTQLHQVVLNLCTNAAHAMHDSGSLTVSLREVALDHAGIDAIGGVDLRPGRYVQLSVADTGEGMKSEVLGRIFDPYFTTKAPGKGTGLGLSVVHGIVKRHGGEIKVRSQVAVGTTFDVFIPSSDINAPEESSGLQAPARGTERVLWVDDEPAIARLGARMLEPLGYRVTTKTNAVEALEHFRAQPDAFDLVVTDYTMPGMVGTELTAAIRRIRADIPVVISTGYSERLTPAEARKVGIAGVAMKPLDRRALAALVRRVLDGAARG